MDLSECETRGFIVRAAPNPHLARSLLESAKAKHLLIRRAGVDAATAATCVALAYEALRATLEALSCLEGFKVLNHICLGNLLKSRWSGFDHFGFERLRTVRNRINYYGENVTLEEGEALILAAKRLEEETKRRIKGYFSSVASSASPAAR